MSSIRRLLSNECGALQAHLLRLEPDSRRDRFCGLVSDESIERYCAAIDWGDGLVIGWFEAGVLRAAVQLAPFGPIWPREAELAVTVEPDWQDQGVGTELCRRALLAAQNRAFASVRMICLQENRRIQRIVSKLRGQLLYLDGASEGRLALPPPNMLSLWQEAFGEGGALLDTLVESWQPSVPAEMLPTPPRAGGRRRAA